MEKLIKTNMKYCTKFDLKITEQDRTLPIIYWLPKVHKTPIGARFIVPSKNLSTKPLPDKMFEVFKMIFNHVIIFRRKSLRYTCLKKF